MPIAFALQNEGKEVYVGQIQDVSELKNGDPPEEAEDKKERLSQYEGMLKKYPAEKLLKALLKVKDPSEYFVVCDQNNLWYIGEKLSKAGFKGMLPLKEDYEFEKDRKLAMDFVSKNYPDVQIIPHNEYKTVEEARAATEASDVPLVIQSEGDHVATIVGEDDVEKNKITILSALDRHEKEYAKGSIILKEKLVKPVEITPEMVFWNGDPVFTDVDIETKNIGDGENNGNQVGCGTNLIVRTELDDEINRIAFPPAVHEMAKKRGGLFVWDISLYFTDQGIFFGEFCPNRFGYDAVMTECEMSGSVSAYFEAIQKGVNPLIKQFGGAVRVFNLNRTKDQEITVGKPDSTWLYEVKKKDDKLLSVGDCWDLGVITGAGDSIEDAVKETYENYSSLVFKEKYVRSKEDFLSVYPTSIIHRFKETNGVYFSAPDIDIEEKQDLDLKKMAQNMEKLGSDLNTHVESITKGVSALKDLAPQITQTRSKFKDKLKKMMYGKS